LKGFTPLVRTRTRRRMSDNASSWLSAVDGLADVHNRLRRVVVENRPALEIIRREDGPGTLFYCDPPYLHVTRATTDAYACEMTEADHRELLSLLLELDAKVMLSGYPSRLYDETLRNWNRHVKEIPNHAAGGRTKAIETEALWCNF
jgi:DNA adenine methylase